MDSQIIEIDSSEWSVGNTRKEWIAGLEAGKVLYLPHLAFNLSPKEQELLTPEVRDPKVRNISLDDHGVLKGAQGSAETLATLAKMVDRFRVQALALIHSLVPYYAPSLRLAPTSFRPSQVEDRVQSWRADDRRLHIDAFPSRPNYGERILRVFANVNPDGAARVWRVGEPFETVARTFLPRAEPYVRWQARAMRAAGITKSLRSEYDHLMLQLHDGMKRDTDYQRTAEQVTMPFSAGSAWVCFSDQTSHAVMAGQHMLEQTLHLPAAQQVDPSASPLAILSRLTGRKLVD